MQLNATWIFIYFYLLISINFRIKPIYALRLKVSTLQILKQLKSEKDAELFFNELLNDCDKNGNGIELIVQL